MSVIHLNEDETTSSSRIFIKILFQELAEFLGMPKLQERLEDDILRPSYEGLFPIDNPRNTRFSINYFTSIGMGAVTEKMREHLKNTPKPAAILPPPASDSVSESSYSSYSSYSSSSRSRSYPHSPSRSRPDPRRDRGRPVSPFPLTRKGRGRPRTRSVSSYSSRSRSPPDEQDSGEGHRHTRFPILQPAAIGLHLCVVHEKEAPHFHAHHLD